MGGSKSCRLILFRIMASVLLLAGLALCILGLSTSALFVSLLRGRDLAIRRVDISFGLFRSILRVEYSNGTTMKNSFFTFFSDVEASNWRGAQSLCLLAVFTGLMVIIVHLLLVFANMLRKWYIILCSMVLQLLVVSFLIAGIALVETQLYFLNTFGDTFLLKLLRQHDLLRYTGGPLDRNFRGPMYTYWILVAADFCFLFAALCCLPEFVYVVEERRRQKRDLLQKPTRV